MERVESVLAQLMEVNNSRKSRKTKMSRNHLSIKVI